MREGLERLVLLPFTIGFVSESSIAIGVQQQPRSSQSDVNPSSKRTKEEDEEDSLASGENMKNSFRSLGLPKPKISIGIHRLFRGFKSFSQLFVISIHSCACIVYYKDEIGRSGNGFGNRESYRCEACDTNRFGWFCFCCNN